MGQSPKKLILPVGLESANDGNAIVESPMPETQRLLSLFQTFYGPKETHAHLSNVIDLWDVAPKFVSTERREAGQDGDCLERTFEWRRKPHCLRVEPATLTRADGSPYRLLPTGREELVEASLRKIALLPGHGFVATEDGLTVIGVRFSQSMLRREMARLGHAIAYENLMESLAVLSHCRVGIAPMGAQLGIRRSPILCALGWVNRADWHADRDAQWSAHFHPMVSNALLSFGYRQFDHDQMMAYRIALARWLHRHMASDCRNAGIMHPVKILLSFAIANSGLLNHGRLRDSAGAMEDALEEMKSAGRKPVRTYERTPVMEGRKIADVQYVIHPSLEFIGMSKAANRRQTDGQESDNPRNKRKIRYRWL